jgi:preprotein translocase subunit SecF
MRLFKTVPKIDFMRLRRFWLGFSTVTSLLAIAVILIKGFHFGIDFTGGTLIELTYPQPMQTETVRDTLAQAGYGDTVVQHFGTTHDVLVRMPPREGLTSAEISNKVVDALKAAGQEAELRRVEFVGPQVGAELAENGALALIFALIGILVYIALRFESKLALAAVVATLHDTLLTAGFYALLPWDFDLTVLAALLTVVGYSLNDTIVIFDRIRENFRLMRSAPALEVVNASINQTLSRSIMTHVTVALVLIALWVFGGHLNRPFAVTMLLGVVIGTYSSIYIASPVAVLLGVDRKAMLPVRKEGLGADDRP